MKEIKMEKLTQRVKELALCYPKMRKHILRACVMKNERYLNSRVLDTGILCRLPVW